MGRRMTIEEARQQNRLNAVAIIFSLFIAAYLVGAAFPPPLAVEAEAPDYIPTIKQLQQALIDTGLPRYDVGPKGADGNPGPDTLGAWKNYSFDQYANKYFEGESK